MRKSDASCARPQGRLAVGAARAASASPRPGGCRRGRRERVVLRHVGEGARGSARGLGVVAARAGQLDERAAGPAALRGRPRRGGGTRSRPRSSGAGASVAAARRRARRSGAPRPSSDSTAPSSRRCAGENSIRDGQRTPPAAARGSGRERAGLAVPVALHQPVGRPASTSALSGSAATPRDLLERLVRALLVVEQARGWSAG